MRLPDYEDGIAVAAATLQVERDEVERLIRCERLHQAILKPAACVGGVPLHRTRGEIVKCLFTACAQDGIVPRKDARFAWLMVLRTVQINGYRLRLRTGDDDRLRGFAEQLRDGIDPGRPLADWLEERIRLADGARVRAQPRPLHVTSPMNGLTKEVEEKVAAWANAVDSGLEKFLADRCRLDAATTLRPQIYPAIGRSKEAIQQEIESRLHRADGLVILAPQGSWGAGIELEIGLRGMIPTLFLHPANRPPGERARLRLAAAEATVTQFDDDPDDPKATIRAITELVYRWLDRMHTTILGIDRRRASVQARLSRFQRSVRIRRTEMGGAEERKALAAAGLSQARARTLIEEDLHLQFASLTELLALSNAYKVPANIDGIVPEPAGDRQPYLTELELNRLREVVRADRIPSLEAVGLMSAAQEEVALGGRRRKLYTSNESWRQLRAKLNRAA